jgi:tRNA modification GTPase
MLDGSSTARPLARPVAAIDQVVATYFPAPRSYTGDDVVELGAHGSPVILRAIIEAATSAGARLAEPGEFTLRAYLNGRLDLVQAEAVADLIDAATPLQARAAFDQLHGTLTRAIGEIDRRLFDVIARLEASIDFPDEGYHFIDAPALAHDLDDLRAAADALLAGARRGRLIREGLQIAIAGRPNVGKSSLFNALAGAARAIVTDVPGTTRDLVTETIDIEGLRVTVVDTAGDRDAVEQIEAEGVARAREARLAADLVLVVIDCSQPVAQADLDIIEQITENKRLIVENKCDLASEPRAACPGRVLVSARTGEGLDELRREIVKALDAESLADDPAITNIRHIVLVQQAREALMRARTAVAGDQTMSEEFVLADLQQARASLEEICGRRTPDDLLAHIFTRFCVGK